MFVKIDKDLNMAGCTSTSQCFQGGNSVDQARAPCSSSNNFEGQTNCENDDNDDNVMLLNVKTERSDDYCTCLYQHCEPIIPVNGAHDHTRIFASSAAGGTQDISIIIGLLREAGILDNVKEMVGDLREKDEHLLSEIKLKKQCVDEEIGSINMACNTKKEEIEKQMKKLEQMKEKLDQLKQKKEVTLTKRKRLEDEGSNLSKKLKCCYDLLKVVPVENE